MSIDEYIKFYNNCVKDRKFRIEKYIPVQDYIIKIFKHYDEIKEFRTHGVISGPKGKRYNRSQLEFIRDLLKLFSRIMKDKKYDNLDEYINLLLENNSIRWYSFISALTIFVYKDDYPIENENFDNYYNKVDKICDLYRKASISNENNLPIAYMLRIYSQYYKLAREELTDDYEDWQFIYIYLAPYIVAEYHLHDYDTNSLEPLLAYVYNNQKEISDYVSMNYYCYSLYEEKKQAIASTLIEDFNNQKIIIK